MQIQSTLRHALRTLGQRFPQLRRFGGRLGLGRRFAPNSTVEQIHIDGDVVIEFDLGIPIFRYIYFQYDLTWAPEAILIRRLLKSTDALVDVGANIGYLALGAAKYAGHVFAFEPSPKTFAYLQRNIQLNPLLQSKITARAIALSNQPGQLQLYRPLSHPDEASLQPLDAPDVIIEQVEVDTLDRVLADSSISFLKIDVEGAEFNVLLGAIQVIERNRPIVLCELFEPFQQRFGHGCQDIVNFFHERQYAGYHVKKDSAQSKTVALKPLDLAGLSTTDANNALFVPVEQTAQILERLAH